MSLLQTGIDRRAALRGIVAAAAAGAMSPLAAAGAAADKAKAPGRMKQSLCRWTSNAPLPDLCRRLKSMGFAGIDLIYLRLSSILCAADRVLPKDRGAVPKRRQRKRSAGRFRR